MSGARVSRSLAGAVLLAALTGLAGCGAPRSTEPAAIPASEVPYRLLDPADVPLVASAQGVGTGRSTPVYLLDQAGTLVPAPTAVADGPTVEVAEQALARLQAGPTDTERATGLASALGAVVRLALVSVDDGTAQVEVRLTAGDLAADQVPLALGQVVLTLTSVPGIDGVQLVSDGDPVEMALPGGVRTIGPVSATDYEVLTQPAG